MTSEVTVGSHDVNAVKNALASTDALPAVDVSGVTKTFVIKRQTRPALGEINMSIPAGRVISIVGPTGCGKTTLLNIIGGFERPTEGTVRVRGVTVNGPSPECGYVFQEANLFPWLDVFSNVIFAARYGHGLRKDWSDEKHLRAKVDQYLENVGLADARKLYPYQISGGMRARAALARVLVANTSVLLLDEPFSSLDALTRAALHRLLLGELAEDVDRTIVLITHDIEEALILSHEVYVMSPSPGTILERYDVPLGWPRDYDEAVVDARLTAQKKLILDRLLPYIRI
ncbi:MAG: ABC transporter ATP-binding protein [Actinomycetota bacterium]|nr:ABC transporter ATP-binding protein [Actinomycetota bacterium]